MFFVDNVRYVMQINEEELRCYKIKALLSDLFILDDDLTIEKVALNDYINYLDKKVGGVIKRRMALGSKSFLMSDLGISCNGVVELDSSEIILNYHDYYFYRMLGINNSHSIKECSEDYFSVKKYFEEKIGIKVTRYNIYLLSSGKALDFRNLVWLDLKNHGYIMVCDSVVLSSDKFYFSLSEGKIVLTIYCSAISTYDNLKRNIIVWIDFEVGNNTVTYDGITTNIL